MVSKSTLWSTRGFLDVVKLTYQVLAPTDRALKDIVCTIIGDNWASARGDLDFNALMEEVGQLAKDMLSIREEVLRRTENMLAEQKGLLSGLKEELDNKKNALHYKECLLAGSAALEAKAGEALMSVYKFHSEQSVQSLASSGLLLDGKLFWEPKDSWQNRQVNCGGPAWSYQVAKLDGNRWTFPCTQCDREYSWDSLTMNDLRQSKSKCECN